MISRLKRASAWTNSVRGGSRHWAPSRQAISRGRMFYDTGASTNNLALLVQALHGNPQHIDIDDPKDAFDMRRCITGDTGTSSTWVQMVLALMMGYGDGNRAEVGW